MVPRSATAPLVRRKTSDLRVPGAFVDHRQSFDQERNLDEHLRKIEVAFVTRRQSAMNLHHQLSVQSGRSLQHRPSIQSRSSSISDRTLQHKSSVQSRTSMQSERSLQHRTSMHSERGSLHHNPSVQSHLRHKSSVHLPAVDELGKRSPPIRVDSRSRYREQRPLVNRAHTTIGTKQIRPATSHQVESLKTDAKLNAFRRLSLGDISPSLGDISKMFE